jgi:hypothetical protein
MGGGGAAKNAKNAKAMKGGSLVAMRLEGNEARRVVASEVIRVSTEHGDYLSRS